MDQQAELGQQVRRWIAEGKWIDRGRWAMEAVEELRNARLPADPA
jgi:hypothetical protein